ncbi:hypothetical protein M0813_08166 [Anaeramoeba flamelloides]|uniref:Ribosomal protein L34 n=1 Tax=Anaeramoeba flamelloides TaxID=1746091 RepID=A0ABQ8XAZ1_9EUKA|nr:hypothetical protein M0813_08166 [Anaeramoeba flamelloides]
MINPYWRPNYLGLSIIRKCHPNRLYPTKRKGWHLGICVRCNKAKPRVCILLKMTLITLYNGNKLQKIHYPTHQFRICFECLRSKDLLPKTSILKVNNQILSICVFNIFTEKILGSFMIKKVLQIQKKRIRETEKRIQAITLQFKEQKRFLKSANETTPNFVPSNASLDLKTIGTVGSHLESFLKTELLFNLNSQNKDFFKIINKNTKKEKEEGEEKEEKKEEEKEKKKEKEKEEKKKQKKVDEQIEKEVEEEVEGDDYESEDMSEDEKKKGNDRKSLQKTNRFIEPHKNKDKGLYKEANCRNKQNKNSFGFKKFLDLQKRNFKKNQNKKQNFKLNSSKDNGSKSKTTNKNKTEKYFSLKKRWIKQSDIQQQQIKSKSIINLMPNFVKKRKIKVFSPNNPITNNFQNQTEFKNTIHNFKNLKQNEQINDFILKKHIFDNQLKKIESTLQVQKKKIDTKNNNINNNNNKNKINSSINKYNKNNYNNNNNNNKYTKNRNNNNNKNKNNERFVQIKHLPKINMNNKNKLNSNFNSENQKEFNQKRALSILPNQKTNLKNNKTRTIKNNRYQKSHQPTYQNINPKRTRFNSNVSGFQTKNNNLGNNPNTNKQTKGTWGAKTNQSFNLQRHSQNFPIKNSLFNQKVNYTFNNKDQNNWGCRIEVDTNDLECANVHDRYRPNNVKIQEKFIDNETIRNFTETHNKSNFFKKRKRKKKKTKKKIIGETLFL